jgi:hypothetical protein
MLEIEILIKKNYSPIASWLSKYSHLLFWISRYLKIENENDSLDRARDIEKLLESEKIQKVIFDSPSNDLESEI